MSQSACSKTPPADLFPQGGAPHGGTRREVAYARLRQGPKALRGHVPSWRRAPCRQGLQRLCPYMGDDLTSRAHATPYDRDDRQHGTHT